MTVRILQFLFFTLLLHSCVDRISIPEEKSGSLVLNCEAVIGSDSVTATLSTSNNLSGSEPIIAPEDAVIEIFGIRDNFDAKFTLHYVPEERVYRTKDNISALWTGMSQHRIRASIPSDLYEPVDAKVTMPRANTVATVTGGPTVEAEVGTDVYQGRDITITLEEPEVKPAFYQISVREKLTTTFTNEDGEIEYNITSEEIPMEIVDVISGGAGAVNMVHKDGLLLDQSRLEDNTFSISVNATSPKQSEDQVLSTFIVEVLSVTKDFYDYHKAKSNTITGSDGTLNEPPIWASNINGGFGLFSTTTRTTSQFEVR